MHSIECILQVPGNFFANDALICKSSEMPCRTSAITQPPHWHRVPYHATAFLLKFLYIMDGTIRFLNLIFLATYTMLPTYRVSPTPKSMFMAF